MTPVHLQVHQTNGLRFDFQAISYSGPAHWGLGEIDGLPVPPGKASTNILTDHLITG